MEICRLGCINLVIAYLRQMGADYKKAICKGDIETMKDIEEHIRSDDFFGEIAGVTPETTIAYLKDISKRTFGKNKNTCGGEDVWNVRTNRALKR